MKSTMAEVKKTDNEKLIAELREEMSVVQRILDSYVSHGGEVWRRISARLRILLVKAMEERKK